MKIEIYRTREPRVPVFPWLVYCPCCGLGESVRTWWLAVGLADVHAKHAHPKPS